MGLDRRTVTKVGDELVRYQEIMAVLENEEGIDEQTLLDTLEGETDLHEALCVVGEQIQENDSMIAGLDDRIKKLDDRKARFKASSTLLRNIILMAMDKAKIKTITGPLFTLSARKVNPKLVIENEALIPSQYFVTQEPSLDRSALTQALKDLGEGETIPGAKLGEEGVSLSIRTK